MGLETEGRRRLRFEFSGGALCLDFANSWGFRGDPGSDRLRDFDALLAFAQQAELLPAAGSGRPADQGPAAQRAFERAKRLREAIFRSFSAVATGRAADSSDLEVIEQHFHEGMASLRIASVPPAGFRLQWDDADRLQPDFLLWPVARSAAELLTSSQLTRVRECDATDCNWLFLDRSRAGSRRWCSMQSCGNRAKARRHYQRQKPAAG